MTYNIAHGAYAGGDLAPLADVIATARPDVVGLQEVDVSWSRSGGADQAAELARRLGMRYRFTANLDCAARDGQGDGFCRYGTAILSRHPILSGTERRFTLPGAAGEESRSLARALVRVRGRAVEVLNTPVSSTERLRVRQVAAIRALVARDRRAFVLLGDFNALPFHLEMVSLRRVARDAAIAAGRPGLRTTNLPHPVRLDYVFLPRPPRSGPPRRLLALHADVITSPRVSDHRPLVVRVRLP